MQTIRREFEILEMEFSESTKTYLGLHLISVSGQFIEIGDRSDSIARLYEVLGHPTVSHADNIGTMLFWLVPLAGEQRCLTLVITIPRGNEQMIFSAWVENKEKGKQYLKEILPSLNIRYVEDDRPERISEALDQFVTLQSN